MKSVIIFALLCCSYAVEQHGEAAKVPQELKEFVEQHIKSVKQQLPIVQQLIKDGKLKVDAEKSDTPIKQLVVPTVVALPPFVVEKITKLQNRVKNVMQQVETHIPQVINQQIAIKKQIAEQAKSNELAEKKVAVEIPKNVVDVVQQIHHHIPQVIHHHLTNKKTRSIKEDVKVPEKVKDIVALVHQHVPQVVSQHVHAQVQQKETQETPAVPANIQAIVTQAHQHIPQIVQQHIAQVANKNGQEQPIVPQLIQGIVEQAHQHIPQVINQHIAQHKPQNIQGIVTQAHQQLSDVINQQMTEVQQKDIAQDLPKQDVLGQQFTEVVNTHVILNKDAQEPTDIKSIVTKIRKDTPPSHVQDVIQQVVPVRKDTEVPQNVQHVVSLVSQHIPQVINHQTAMKKEKEVKMTN